MISGKAAYVMCKMYLGMTYLGKYVERTDSDTSMNTEYLHQMLHLKSVSNYINPSGLVLLKLKTRYILKANMFALAPQLGPADSMFKNIGDHICMVSRARSSDTQ